ncbi:MAG: cytochrome c [Nitrospirota bacterium]
MKRLTATAASLCFAMATVAFGAEQAASLQAPPRDLSDPCLFNGRVKLTPSERAGCEIWFKAAAGTARFFTYVFQQRLGTLVDWYGVMKAPARATRFDEWGLVNDPACCKPGDPDCPAKSLEETYGFDYCPGDEVLLTYVGKHGYKDPACELNDATPSREEIEGGIRFPKKLWQSPCDLEFGTSAGAMGFRKFPNPRFDREAWAKLNKGLATWDGFRKKLSDGSVEPPFLVGMACGACHIAFDPLKPFKPPHSPAYPAAENLSGTVGNQYSRVLPIFVSGMPRQSLEWQVFALVRPGTVDTSAIPTDQVNNTGTMNALINLKRRPTFPHDVRKWRPVKSGEQCTITSEQEQCWCEPGKDGKKCWKKSLKREQVHNILKGGEDSIGALEALQRVYINIGSCAESAWVNHLTDMMQLDPRLRGYGQTPMDIGQARRDCPNFRAIEDRLPDLLNYLMTGAPADLREARENERRLKDPDARYTEADLVKDLEADLRADVERGRRIFAKKCAGCHSSLPEDQENGKFVDRDFRALDPATGLRKDWLGNDKPTAVTKLEVNASRALHSNHMKGHLWEEYSSETYRGRSSVTLPMSMDDEPARHSMTADGGRGYYRNVSLLSLWAYAPFMHDNATGPELCGGPAKPPACEPFDPSVEGRYRLFKKSMDQLLNPDKRSRKVTPTNGAKHIGPLGMELIFPDGKPAALIGNYRHKEFINDFKGFLAELRLAFPDLQNAMSKPEQFGTDLQKALADPGQFTKLKGKFASRFGPEKGEQHAKATLQAFAEILGNPKSVLDKAHDLSEVYSNSVDLDENKGTPSGHPLYELFEDGRLTQQDKNDLTAFLATL